MITKRTSFVKKIGNNPWVTRELIELINERNKYFRYKKKYKSAYVENKYRSTKRQASNLNHKLKMKYFENQLTLSIETPRKFWQFLNFAVFNNITSTKSIKALSDNNEIVTDNQVIANCFNRHFISNPKIIVSNLSTQNQILSPISYLNYSITNDFIIGETNEDEIFYFIKKLKTNASSGYHEISAKVIQKYSDRFVPIIVKLINECLNQNVFPDILKISKITPIFKNGDILNVDNFRPIATLSTFTKIFEMFICSRLKDHLRDNNIISNHQFGFTEKSNTLAACLELTDFISSAIDKKYYVSCVFIDVSKAFDTVNHQI